MKHQSHSFVKQKWWTCINLKPPSKGALKLIGWNVIHLWNNVMDSHKPKTFKTLSKLAFNPMGSNVIHDELAQTLNPIPTPSLPFPSLQNGFWSPLGGRPILSRKKTMELHKSWFLLNPRNHNTKKIRQKTHWIPHFVNFKNKSDEWSSAHKKRIWLWYYIDLHVQTIFFFFFFFFLLCFSPLLLQLCSRQFDSKLFGGGGGGS